MYNFEFLTLKHTNFVEGITLFDTNRLFLRFFGIYTLVEAGKCKAKPFFKCQCCMQWVSLADAEGSSNFVGNHDTTKVVHPSYNACSFHISFSFYISKSLPLEGKVAERQRGRMRCCRSFVPPHQSASLTASPHGEAFPAPTIILQITLLVSVKARRLYRRIYFLLLPCYEKQSFSTD